MISFFHDLISLVFKVYVNRKIFKLDVLPLENSEYRTVQIHLSELTRQMKPTSWIMNQKWAIKRMEYVYVYICL